MVFPLVIPNAAQVYLHWQNAGRPFTNVLGAIKPAPLLVDQSMAESLGAAIKGALATSGLAPMLGPAVTLDEVGVRSIATAGQPEFLDSGAAVSGTGVTDALPPQTALVISAQTDRSGASYRGRIYLGGWVEGQNDANGYASAGSVTAGMAFVQACSDAMDAVGLAFAVLSRPAEGGTIPEKIIPARAGFATAITSLEVKNQFWDTQRRRGTALGGSTLLMRGRRRRVRLRP